MLVDLARNDVNRVCQPKTVKVDHLMRVENFSHVIHLTSQVSGMLRDGLTRLDVPFAAYYCVTNFPQIRRFPVDIPCRHRLWSSEDKSS